MCPWRGPKKTPKSKKLKNKIKYKKDGKRSFRFLTNIFDICRVVILSIIPHPIITFISGVMSFPGILYPVDLGI